MCGICGVIHFHEAPLDEGLIRRMVEVLHHRGPEGTGVHCSRQSSGTVGLGHTRLKIIDLSEAASQPMSNAEGTVWVVFNGEIYNYRDLGSKLRSAGYRFRSQSDTEVVLHLYEERGDRCVEELDGMFAFAIWDERRKKLFLARDRPGKKPLFYYRDERLFAFASEIKALLQHPFVPVELNTRAFPAFFLNGYVPTPETVYKNIYQLPPAHIMTVGVDGQVEMRQYWDLRFPMDSQRLGVEDRALGAGGRVSATKRRDDDREAAARVRELVTEAVKKRLVADVPIGAFLSGGIDSSIVVGVMSQLVSRPVKTFSIGFTGDSSFDETSYARIAARHFHTDHTEFIVEPRAVELIEKLVWHHDGPFGDSSAIPTYIVSRLTREHVTVALNGDGGDELFAGYLRFYGALLAERLPGVLARPGQWLSSLLATSGNYHGWRQRAHRFFQSTMLPLHLRFLKWESVFFEDLRTILREELECPNLEDGRGYFGTFQPVTAPYSTLSQLLYLNFKTYLLDDLLVKMDRSAMANSLEARSPFLDTALAEYAASLPDRMKLRWGRTKYILKEAFADLLPEKILRRGKMGFGVPLGSWFRGELREYLQDVLCSPQALSRDYLNHDYVKQLVDEHLSGRRDVGYRLWTLLTFEVWLRMLAGKTAFRLGQQPALR